MNKFNLIDGLIDALTTNGVSVSKYLYDDDNLLKVTAAFNRPVYIRIQEHKLTIMKSSTAISGWTMDMNHPDSDPQKIVDLFSDWAKAQQKLKKIMKFSNFYE